MRKIMFVCQSLGNGGAERVVSILSDSMVPYGDEIYILAMSGKNRVYHVHENVHVLVPAKKIKSGILGKIQRINLIRKAAKKNKIDVIIAFSHYNAMFSVLAAAGLDIKVIGSERNDPAQLDHRKITNSIRMMLYKKLDCLVCQTDMAKAYFPEAIQKKSVVIMNPISEYLPEPYTGEREKRIVTFCRLEPQKNLPMLIDAFEMLNKDFPEYELEIYGEGKEKDNLLDYIQNKKLEEKIHLLPFAKDIHEKVLKASMFALSSDYEGMSNSMLEAMAIGLPAVVTDCPCGGARMVIEDGVNGMLVPVKSASAMHQKFKSIILNPEMAQTMSTQAVLIRERLSANEIAEEWMRIIDLKKETRK